MAQELVEFVNGRVRLNLHPGQTAAWDSTARFTFILAGTQSGKTSFLPWKLHQWIDRFGSGDYIAATASYDLFKLKFLPEIRNVFEHILGIGRYWAGDKIMELCDPETGIFRAKRADDPMWSRIILRSASAEGGLESASAKAAILDEVGHDDFGLGAWQGVIRRLSLSRGPIMGATTLYNLGWLKQQVFDKRNEDPDINIIQFASTLNPQFPKEEMEDARRRLPEWKYLMFYEGKYGKPSGMIYKDFVNALREQGGHKVRPFALPVTWPRWVGVDPGAVNTAKIWLAQDVEHEIFYLYRESLGGGRSTAEHVKEALRLAEENKENVIRWCVGNKSETQVRMDWQSAGASPVMGPPFADVESGLDKVIQLFKEFRLFIFEDCVGTLDEIGSYSRKLDDQDEPTEDIKNKEKYHHLDALRYIAVQVTMQGVFVG